MTVSEYVGHINVLDDNGFFKEADDLTASMKDDPCWDGYEMVGTKKKNGKEVPNCVPKKEAFFKALKIAHDKNPLVKVLKEYGFEPASVFEYGDDDKVDSIHPSEQSVHRKRGTEDQEIWIEFTPEGKMEYGYVHDDGESGHEHKYFDNLDDLIAHITEEDEERHPCKNGGECQCGGSCRTAEKKPALNRPFRTPSGPKKFSVYVKNDKGHVVKVNFGDPHLEIKRDNPERKKNFRARHHCENPGPKWKAKFWSCKNWSNKPVSDIVKNKK